MSAATERIAALRTRLVTTVLRRVVVLVRALDDDGGFFPLPSELRLAVLAENDLAAYGTLRPGHDSTEICARAARGDLCFAVHAGERIVHATWASTVLGPLPYLHADAALEDGDVCLYDSFTALGWRGRDLSRSRDELCRRHYRAAGLHRAVALVARENAAGLRTTVPLGYRAIGEYGLLRLGRLQRLWSTSTPGERVPRLIPRGASGDQHR